MDSHFSYTVAHDCDYGDIIVSIYFDAAVTPELSQRVGSAFVAFAQSYNAKAKSRIIDLYDARITLDDNEQAVMKMFVGFEDTVSKKTLERLMDHLRGCVLDITRVEIA